ncbi:MAG TPA: phosphoribosyltransferase family protein [Candidatus Saccharimonadales bacterium]|nr:phosphoribosyltransferase family protein [Candidatus Saccharimonadales bacterium]
MANESIDKPQLVISQAQLHERIAAMGRQISHDYQGRVVHCVGILDSAFVFVADLIREIEGSVRCQFIKPYTREILGNNTATREIFFAPEVDVEDRHILLCEGILSSGQTVDFLVRNFQARGAASVALCCLLNRPSDRHVNVDVAYSGFEIGRPWLSGFGLGTPAEYLDRNVPFIFAAGDQS